MPRTTVARCKTILAQAEAGRLYSVVCCRWHDLGVRRSDTPATMLRNVLCAGAVRSTPQRPMVTGPFRTSWNGCVMCGCTAMTCGRRERGRRPMTKSKLVCKRETGPKTNTRLGRERHGQAALAILSSQGLVAEIYPGSAGSVVHGGLDCGNKCTCLPAEFRFHAPTVREVTGNRAFILRIRFAAPSIQG